MLGNEHINAAANVIRDQVLRTEHATNNAAEETAHLIAIMLKKRGEFACPVSVGAAEVDRGYQALGRTLSSLRSLAIMHAGLHTVASAGEEGWDYGPHETVPNKPGNHLRAA